MSYSPLVVPEWLATTSRVVVAICPGTRSGCLCDPMITCIAAECMPSCTRGRVGRRMSRAAVVSVALWWGGTLHSVHLQCHHHHHDIAHRSRAPARSEKWAEPVGLAGRRQEARLSGTMRAATNLAHAEPSTSGRTEAGSRSRCGSVADKELANAPKGGRFAGQNTNRWQCASLQASGAPFLRT